MKAKPKKASPAALKAASKAVSAQAKHAAEFDAIEKQKAVKIDTPFRVRYAHVRARVRAANTFEAATSVRAALKAIPSNPARTVCMIDIEEQRGKDRHWHLVHRYIKKGNLWKKVA